MDRRRFRRWPRQLDVRVWKHGEEGQAFRAISTNVSRTGIFVRTQLVLPSGSRVRLEVNHSSRSFVAEGVDVPIIVSSGYVADEGAGRLMDAGTEFFISKPFSSETLLTTIRGVLVGRV